MYWLFFIVIILLLIIISPLVLNRIPDIKTPLPPAPDPARIMKGAEDFYKKGKSKYLFLFIHGYNDSPFQMKPLADALYRSGHSVYGILLPGHGTKIEDMVHVRYHHWYEHVENTLQMILKKKKKIFLVGQSLGASLSLHLAGNNPDLPLQGIIAVSSPLHMTDFINGKLIIHKPYLLYAGLIRIFSKITSVPDRTTHQDICPYVGYGKNYAMANLHSFIKALPAIRKAIPEVKVPLLSIMSTNDKTVSFEDQSYLHRKAGSTFKKACATTIRENKTTRHLLITHKETTKFVIQCTKDFIRDCTELK